MLNAAWRMVAQCRQHTMLAAGREGARPTTVKNGQNYRVVQRLHSPSIETTAPARAYGTRRARADTRDRMKGAAHSGHLFQEASGTHEFVREWDEVRENPYGVYDGGETPGR